MEELICEFQNVKKTSDFDDAGKLMKEIFLSVDSNHKNFISPAVIRKIYQQYRIWRNLINSKQIKAELNLGLTNFVNEFECEILKYLLERCYWMQYGDSEVVAYLLIATYEVRGDLGKIFDYRDDKFWLHGVHGHPREVIFVKSTFNDRKLARKKVTPVDYFLDHANKKNISFGGKRLSEQCFTSCKIVTLADSQKSLSLPPCSLSFKYPELLLKLLRYGLFINAMPDDSDVGKLLTGIIGVLLNHPKDFNDPSGDFAREYVIKVRNMGMYLLRAIKSVDPSNLMKFQSRKLAKRRMLWKMNEVYLPNLVQRFHRVQSLKHICRCRVRKILYDSWNLPKGIEILSIPKILKDYLNLERD